MGGTGHRPRAVILGGGGMLARALKPALEAKQFSVELLPRQTCDIANEASVRAMLERALPALIANCAAYTQVDKAEQNVDLAFAINATGAGNVARVAKGLDVPLCHISSDYVFDGNQRTPYAEDAPTGPRGVYARSKRAGEEEVLGVGGKVYLVRTGELYGEGGPNFFDAILNRARTGKPLKVVSDQVVAPTWTRELAQQLAVVLSEAPPGLYHATCSGQTSWYEAARTALKLCQLEVPVEPVTTEQYGSPTPRSLYTVLSHGALERLGLYQMRPWDVALAEWLRSERQAAEN